MRYTLVLFFFMLFAGTTKAQNSTLPENKQVWKLDNYDGTATITILENKKARVEHNGIAYEFVLKSISPLVKLAYSSSNDSMLRLLNIPEPIINAKYAAANMKGLSPAEKLLTRARELENKMIITNPNLGDINGTNTTSINTFPEEEITQATGPVADTATEGSSMLSTILIVLLTALAAGAAGYLIARKSIKADTVSGTVEIEEEIEEEEPVTQQKTFGGDPVKAEKKTRKTNVNIDKMKSDLTLLKQSNKELKAYNSSLEKQVAEYNTFEQKYFEAVFNKIILPLQEAIDQGNNGLILKYLTMSALLLSSTTRFKIHKKLNFDESNIQVVFGNLNSSRSFPVIDKNTPSDKIPNNVKALLRLFKDYGVDGLDDIIFQGYKIQNLS